jgi:hypothetical protein
VGSFKNKTKKVTEVVTMKLTGATKKRRTPCWTKERDEFVKEKVKAFRKWTKKRTVETREE